MDSGLDLDEEIKALIAGVCASSEEYFNNEDAAIDFIAPVLGSIDPYGTDWCRLAWENRVTALQYGLLEGESRPCWSNEDVRLRLSYYLTRLFAIQLSEEILVAY